MLAACSGVCGTSVIGLPNKLCPLLPIVVDDTLLRLLPVILSPQRRVGVRLQRRWSSTLPHS